MSEPAVSPQLAARRANLEKAQAVPKQVRYRMTEKRLAACRRNLEKARAVAPEIRFRRTEKRLEANRANLRKAREHARVTGATLRHGMSCRTLEESLAGAVGEAQAGPGAAGVCEEKRSNRRAALDANRGCGRDGEAREGRKQLWGFFLRFAQDRRASSE